MTPEPSRILLIRPSALGDVCRSVPLLASLRAAFPRSQIDWLVRDTFAPAIEAHPALSHVLAFPRKALGHSLSRGNPRPTLAWLNRLRQRRYDLVIDAQGLARSGIFARATGAPRRVGFARARELAWLAYTERHLVDLSLHTVDRMLELLRLAGIEPRRDMRLFVPPHAAYFPDTLGLTARRFAVLAPTSIWPSKRWPADRFAALSKELLDRGIVQLVAIVGSLGESEQCEPVTAHARNDPRVVNLVGRTDVAQLMAVIAGAALVVANDSAVLHMGVGFDRPCVALFGPTRVELVGPYGRATDVIQHLRQGDVRDHKHPDRSIIERISVAEVLEACVARLA